MRRYLGFILLGASLFPQFVRADVTLRFDCTVTVPLGLPAQVRDQLVKLFSARIPPKYVQHFRNGKLHFAYADDEAIVDFDKREITLLEGETKRYTVISIEQYLTDVMRLPSLSAPSNPGVAASSSRSASVVTGRTGFISGVETEEHNILLTVDNPTSTLPVTRMVVHEWSARESEIQRRPALRELAPYQRRILEVTEPAGPLGASFRQLPDLVDGFASMSGNFRPEDTVLRLTIDFFVPTIASLARLLRALPAGVASPLADGFDPDVPFVEVTEELVELSAEPIPESVFTVPANYRAVSLAELMADN